MGYLTKEERKGLEKEMHSKLASSEKPDKETPSELPEHKQKFFGAFNDKKILKEEFDLEEKRMKEESELTKVKNEVTSSLLLKKPHEATERITNYILGIEHIHTTRDDEKSEVWIYKNGIFLPEGRTYIKETTRKILDEGYSSHLVNEVVNKIESETYIIQEEFFTVDNINHIAVQNGILNLLTKKLMPFTPKEKHFNKLPVEYKEGIECQNILKHFSEVLQSKNDLPVLQELFGYLLYREYKIEKAFMFTGSGRNGKGKTLELMKRFIGIDNCSNITLQHIESDNFAMGELFNKLANLGGDISRTALKETGNFKSLTGRDLLSAARKFKTRVNFTNYAKMIFCANELPITYDITTAFFNRWILLEFPYTFLSQKEIDNLEKEDDNIKLADPSIIDKMSTDEELSGLLNWALDGLKRLIDNSDFSYSPSTEDVRNKWIRKSDSAVAFLMDTIKECYGWHITKKELRHRYAKYCKTHKIKPTGDRGLKYVLEINYGVTESRKNLDNEQVACWEGIKFIEEETLDVVPEENKDYVVEDIS